MTISGISKGGKHIEQVLVPPRERMTILSSGQTELSPPTEGELLLLVQMNGASQTPLGLLQTGGCMLLPATIGKTVRVQSGGRVAYALFNLQNAAGAFGLPLAFQPIDWPALQPMLRRLTQPLNDVPQEMREDALRFLLQELGYQYRLTRGGRVQDRFSQVLGYLHLHFREPLSIGHIADAFNYNPQYLSRMFREKQGQTIHAYLTQLRLQEAARMLSEEIGTVKDIAGMVGYSDEKLFVRNFKKMYRMPPSVYRMYGRKSESAAYKDPRG